MRLAANVSETTSQKFRNGEGRTIVCDLWLESAFSPTYLTTYDTADTFSVL